ncbi:MAG: 2-amino-4-hydroxy-6-hydroxymethyldihydropteridine diphosphokinase [Anaerolineales bacterium]|nr:2-amino-4-hydroxy-6-hydroxymethyldihydropteridine diphosphokinase [Anaerolineales bacterium]
MDHRVFLGLGTNLGDRAANLEAARGALKPDIAFMAASPVYETAPWGYQDQPSFLNQVLEARTALLPLDLLGRLKNIERGLGRQESFRYGPRLIDIDILLYGKLIFESPELQIPHPAMQDRAFVLVPLADLAPDLVHPKLHKTISDLLGETDPSGVEPYRP